jgi:hypothetical protein
MPVFPLPSFLSSSDGTHLFPLVIISEERDMESGYFEKGKIWELSLSPHSMYWYWREREVYSV